MGCCGGDEAKKSAASAPSNSPASRNKRQRLLEKRAYKFKFGGPTCSGKCFNLLENGVCFRVEDGKRWYIYNDTMRNEVHVMMQFNADISIVKLGNTELKKEEKVWTANLTAYPLETAPFLLFESPNPHVVRLTVRSRPLAQSYLQKVNAKAEAKLKKELHEVERRNPKKGTEEQLLRKCRKHGVMYVDLTFTPGVVSLQRASDAKKVQNLSSITWKRPTDYIPEERQRKIQLFRGGIDPEDIDQGQLGDCWLMCALSVVAGRPSFVRSLFAHPVSNHAAAKESKVGAYRITLNSSGWWENVIVDSYLPTLNSQPIFGRCADDPCALWVALMEKAHAKLHGSYARIIGGDALYALQDLTGFPVLSLDEEWSHATQSREAASGFFKSLRRYKEKGYFLTISTPGRDTSAYTGRHASANPTEAALRYQRAGLAMGHAYAVLDVREFHLPNVKLLRVRNPWGGGGGWTGDWGAGSAAWRKHPLVRAACRPTPREDGTFWMEWSDAVRFFSGGGVCMARRGWLDYRMRGVFLGLAPSVALEVRVRRKVRVVLLLSQRDHRALPTGHPDALYKGLLLSLAGFNRAKGEYVLLSNSTMDPEEPSSGTFTFSVSRDVGMEWTLDPKMSPYYIIPRIMANREETPKAFTLGFLSPTKVGTGGLEVDFKKIPKEHKALRNLPNYTMEDATSISVQFQRKKPDNVATLRVGTSIQKSKKVK